MKHRRLAIATLLMTAVSLVIALVTLILVRGDWSPPAPDVVLATSAERFSQDVQSFEGEFEAIITFDDFEVRTKGDFAFQAPDSLYMTIGFFGQTIEYLMVNSDSYVRIPGEGWFVVTIEEFGIDRAALEEYLDNRGVVDYTDMAQQLEDLTRLPDVTEDGVTYLHYRGTLDFADLADDLPEGLLDPGVLERAQEVLEPADVEVLLQRETFLPRQVDLKMAFNVEGSSFTMDMSLKFTDYDEPVAIPEPPANAKPLESLTEDKPLRPGRTLGLRCGYETKFLRERYDLPPGKGCVVLRVSSPGAAERAGFQIGDKIIRLDGTPITSGRQFTFRFEELPGGREFVVQRGDEELTLQVDLADRAELPEYDPYFYYLRAKADTELLDYEQVIADYTRAIDLEPQFDLAYLYRGITNIGRDDAAARADLLQAFELDPELTEAYRALAQLADRQGGIEDALEWIDRTIELNGCGARVEAWDIDCAEDLIVRNDFYFDRLQPGDDLLIEASLDAIEDVVFFEQGVVFSRFRLAYIRGNDDTAVELGRQFLSTLVNPLFSYLEDFKAGVRYMLDTDSYVPSYSLGGWGQGRLVEAELAGTVPGPGSLAVVEVSEPRVSRNETVSWELWRGSYRFASAEAQNAYGENWVVEFRYGEDALPGRYELRVYVDGELAGTNFADVP